MRYVTEQYVYDRESGEYTKITGPIIEASSWEEAEEKAIDQGCVVIREDENGET